MLFVMAALLVGQRFSDSGREKFCKDWNNGWDLNEDLADAVEDWLDWLEADTEQKPDDNDCPIAKWDVSEIKSTDALFMNDRNQIRTTDFNANLSLWVTSENENMASMFNGANLFNSNLEKWDTSKVKSMGSTFYRASVFNSDISRWCV